jgi:aminopeptidase N
MFGNAIPADVRSQPVDEFLDLVYKVMAQQRMWEPIETPAADFKDEESYGTVEYMKTAVWMHMMEAGIGKWSFLLAMKTYYDQWKFKHPYPEDLEESLEKTLGKPLDEYFALLKKKGNLQ